MATFRWLLALFMLALAALPASAAEPTYPPGSRIGLTPPAGVAGYFTSLQQGFLHICFRFDK